MCVRVYILSEGKRVVTLRDSVSVHLCSIVDGVVVDDNFVDAAKFAKIFVLLQNLRVR